MSLVLADDFYGPFERVDRFLIDPTTGDKIEALEPPEDITISPKEIIYRKFNRPDGCVEAIVMLDRWSSDRMFLERIGFCRSHGL